MEVSDANVPRCWVCGRAESELKAFNPPGGFVDDLIDNQLLSLPFPYKLCNICRWVFVAIINDDKLGLVRLADAHSDAIRNIEQRLDQMEQIQ